MKSTVQTIGLFLMVITASNHLNGDFKEKNLDSMIREVTVYRERAMVTRRATESFQVGFYSIIFPKLPVNLLADSVQVSGTGTAKAKILNVRVAGEDEILKDAVKVEELSAIMKRKKSQIQILNNQLKILNKKETFFQALTEKQLEAVSREKIPQPFSGAKWRAMIDFYEKEMGRISEQKLKLNELKVQFEQSLRSLEGQQEEIEEIAKMNAKQIIVDLDITKPGTMAIDLTYQVPNANWYPSYNFRVNSQNNTGILEYNATVAQNTSEDWRNVKLTLSTAQPARIKKIPTLNPNFMSIKELDKTGGICGTVRLADGDPIPGVLVTISGDNIITRRTVTNERGTFCFYGLDPGHIELTCELESFRRFSARGLKIRRNRVAIINPTMETGQISQEIIIPQVETYVGLKQTSVLAGLSKEAFANLPIGRSLHDLTAMPTLVFPGDISTQFEIKHKNTVKRNKSQRVTIAILELDLAKELIAVPRHSENVFLKAVAKNCFPAPLLRGKVSVFYDGNYLTSSIIPFTSPNDSITVPVGLEKSVEVNRREYQPQTKTRGIFSKKELQNMGYTLTLTNHKSHTIHLTVLDQIPVSLHEKLDIKTEIVGPQPISDQEDPQTGILRWELTLEPTQQQKIHVKYSIRYPRNTIIQNKLGGGNT